MPRKKPLTICPLLAPFLLPLNNTTRRLEQLFLALNCLDSQLMRKLNPPTSTIERSDIKLLQTLSGSSPPFATTPYLERASKHLQFLITTASTARSIDLFIARSPQCRTMYHQRVCRPVFNRLVARPKV